MKRLRQLCAAIALTILLTNIASADEGILHPWYVPPPPPQPTTASKTVSSNSATGALKTNGEETATDLATEITLSLIQSMLALF